MTIKKITELIENITDGKEAGQYLNYQIRNKDEFLITLTLIYENEHDKHYYTRLILSEGNQTNPLFFKPYSIIFQEYKEFSTTLGLFKYINEFDDLNTGIVKAIEQEIEKKVPENA